MTNTSYPTGIAVSPDGKTAYAVLNFNDTLAKIDLTKNPPVEVTDIRVGNVPHSVVISPDGTTAYVSNEAGRIATKTDFQLYSNGTPVVAQNPTGATATGTVSVIDLATFTVTASIPTGLHPTGMAFWGDYLLVANAYDDTVSVIDTTKNAVSSTISLGLPISVPGSTTPAYGAGPNSIAVDEANKLAYVALYNSNAVAVVNLAARRPTCEGRIPVGYAPSSVVVDSADKVLLVANDKGWGTTGNPNPFRERWQARRNRQLGNNRIWRDGLNTHQDLGTVSIIPVPMTSATLETWTKQVKLNNHWDLTANIASAAGGSKTTAPVAIPAHIGDPSLIKHVFLIIRENRTYDQILGDVAGGNGDPSLAVFGDNPTYRPVRSRPTRTRWCSASRFSTTSTIRAASRPTVTTGSCRPWRPTPTTSSRPTGSATIPPTAATRSLTRTRATCTMWRPRPASAEELRRVCRGEHLQPAGLHPDVITNSCEPSWTQFYQDTLDYENGAEPQLYYYNTIGSYTPLPNLMNHTVQNYPQFDLGIPDQYRVDVWEQDFAKDVAAGTVPQLEYHVDQLRPHRRPADRAGHAGR